MSKQEKLKFFEMCKKEHGSITHKGAEYALTQDAYLTDCGKMYTAIAICQNDLKNIDDDHDPLSDPHALIYWDIINHDNDNDESNSCNWDNPRKVEIVD